MIINPKRVLLSLCCTLGLLMGWAQENNCITFEDFETEQNFGARSGEEPGSLAFTQGPVKVKLEPFQYFDGSSDFFNATVYEELFSDFELSQGKSLFVSNINLVFDFTQSEQPVRRVCLAFFDGGGEENISVNGVPIRVLHHLGEAPRQIAPGVTLTIDPPIGDNSFLSTGLLCLEGDIKTLLIGGQEFGLDNICWDTCPLYNLTAGITACEQHPNLYYEYDIQFNFLHQSSQQGGFDLYKEGEFIGYYEYDQLPLTLPQVPNRQGAESFVYTICENDAESCCRDIEIPLAPCEDICLLEARVEEVFCNDSGTEYIALLAVEGQHLSDTLLVSNSQGESYPVLRDPATQLIEVSFIPSENSVDRVTICDYHHPNCCYTLWVQYPCAPPNECQITDLEATILDCYETGAGLAYDVKINFEASSTSNAFFDLYSREGLIDFFSFEEVPVTITGYQPEGNPDNLWFKVTENDNPDCQAVTEVSTAECQSECGIENVTVWEIDCNASGTEYLALISIEGQGLSNKFKATNAAGESFFYEYPPPGSEVQIGFSTRESGTDRIEICDAEYEDCCFELEIEYPCQPNFDCEINGLEAIILDCYETDHGLAYDVKINFEASGTSNAFFDLYSREGLIDFFSFEEVPVTITGYQPEGHPDNLWFKVTENDNPDCQAVTEVSTSECQSECGIENVTVWEIDCNASGTEYLALISIEGQGLSNKFKATNAAGESFFYEYPPPGSEVQIGFSTRESRTDRIEICDYENPNCCKVIEVEYDCQPNFDCEIRDLTVAVEDCELTTAGYAYDLSINFVAEGTSNEQFDLFLQGELYGTYSFANRPLNLSNIILVPGVDILTVKVAENDNLSCHQIVEIPLAPCDHTGDCHIGEVIAEAHNCDGSSYLLDVAFQSSNPGPLGYYIYGDGAIFGPFSYESPFVTIGPFAGDGENIVDILILDIADPSCFGYLEFGPLDCATQCRIGEVWAEPLECVDGSFQVQIGFTAENVGAEGFTIRGNGRDYGSFAYSGAPVIVGPIEGHAGQVLEFVVIDNSNPDCQAFTTLEAIACPSCAIEALDYTVDCQETGLHFILELDFDVTDPASERFFLKFDEETYEGFAYEALPLSLELPLSLAEATMITVCDTEDPDCCQSIPFNIPCCSVRDLVVEAYPCEEDGSFAVDLDLLFTNTSDSFTLVYGPVNGELQPAQYAYEDLHLTLGPLDGTSNASDWLFQVTDESLFCSTSEMISFESCTTAECVGFEDTEAGSFGPLTGFEQGEVFLEEAGITFRLAADCECFVHLVEYPSVFPGFSLAQGQMLVLDGSGVSVDFSNLANAVEEISVDYYFEGSSLSLAVNGAAPIIVNALSDLPEVVAPGITLTVTPSASDPKMGTLTFKGNVDQIDILVEGKMSLDNLCLILGSEEVWPGDINTDNIANHFDLLPLGIAQGAQGPIREDESTDWTGLPAPPWDQSFPNGVNYKHADTDGNGLIEAFDKTAILDNFLLTHGEVVPFEPMEATPNNPSLFIETPSDGWPAGQAFRLPIVLGTTAIPVDGIHGLAFSIRFDPEVIRPERIELDFSDSWLGQAEQDLLTLDKTIGEEGVIYLALSRVGSQDLFGSGPVASLIGIIDDIAGLESTPLHIEAPLAVTATMDTIPIFTESSELIIQRFQDVPALDLLNAIVLSPNPTHDEVNISNKYGVRVDQVDVMDSAGNLLTTVKEGANRISLKAHPAGVYMLRIRMGQVIAHRRVIRL